MAVCVCWARLEVMWLSLSAVPGMDLHLQLLDLFGGSLVFVCVGLGWKLCGCLCVLGQVGKYCGFNKCCSCLGPPPPASQSLWCVSVLKLGCGVS